MSPATPADPRAECARIARELGTVVFPWDTTRSLEMALFRTFASPRIGAVLNGSGEFAARAQKRYDDTDLIVSEIVEHGFDGDRGMRAIARMNAIHARFRIANEDFLYVLSTFVFEPIRWNARFGWRVMTDPEKIAWFQFWCHVGERMNLQQLPVDYDAFERFNLDYEAANLRFTPANQRVALATREMFASWFPAVVRPLVRVSINGLLDARLLEAFDLKPAPAWLSRSADLALKARARVLRWLPKRRRPRLRTQLSRADYPQGYRIESLGPPPHGS